MGGICVIEILCDSDAQCEFENLSCGKRTLRKGRKLTFCTYFVHFWSDLVKIQ